MYIVFDLEFNQDFSDESVKKINGYMFPFEIIQIGAVKLDYNFNVIDTFNRYIRPDIYKKVDPFIEKFTGINNEMLINEKTFLDVYNEFLTFTDDINSIFCVWGMSDIRELYRSAEYYNQNINLLPKMYINLQPYSSLYFHLPKKAQLKLQSVVDMLQIPITHDFHNALNDAYYTTAIFKKINNESIKPVIYNPNYIKPRIRQPKKLIDIKSLINQFEKMYKREITEDEKLMIILAYKMGKTGQFLKEKEDITSN